MLHYPLSFRDLKHKRNTGQTFSVTFNALRHLGSQVIRTTLPPPPPAQSPPRHSCESHNTSATTKEAEVSWEEQELSVQKQPYTRMCQKDALKILAISQHPTHPTDKRIQFKALQSHLIPPVTQSLDICMADFSSTQSRADPPAALSKVLQGQQFTRLCNRAKSSTAGCLSYGNKVAGLSFVPF